MTSITASAHSATTSTERSRVRSPPAEPPCPPSPLSEPCRSTRRAWSAGTMPNSRPAPIATTSVIVSTRRSTDASAMRGMSAGASATSRRTPATARPAPSAAATTASSSPSAANWRIMRSPLAPSAVRTATSRRRALPRASSRFATFAHATSSTSPTADSSTRSAGRTGPKTTAPSGSTKTPRAAFSGYARSRSAAIRAELLLRRRHAAAHARDHEDRMRRSRQRLGGLLQRQPDVDRRPRPAIRERPRVVGRRQDLEHAEVRAALHDPDDREQAGRRAGPPGRRPMDRVRTPASRSPR